MIFLYVIKSEVNGFLYVGICKDIEKRIKQHNSGQSKFTKAYSPWKLVYKEEFSDWSDARVKEKYYKNGSGKEKLRLMIANVVTQKV